MDQVNLFLKHLDESKGAKETNLILKFVQNQTKPQGEFVDDSSHSSVFILGMHRSGTSVVTGLIEKMGFFFGRKN